MSRSLLSLFSLSQSWGEQCSVLLRGRSAWCTHILVTIGWDVLVFELYWRVKVLAFDTVVVIDCVISTFVMTALQIGPTTVTCKLVTAMEQRLSRQIFANNVKFGFCKINFDCSKPESLVYVPQLGLSMYWHLFTDMIITCPWSLLAGGYYFGQDTWVCPTKWAIFVTQYYASRPMSSCGVCVCVSVTFMNSVKTNKHIIKNCSPSGSHTIQVYPCQTAKQYFDGNPPNGGVECRWDRQKSRFCASINACC